MLKKWIFLQTLWNFEIMIHATSLVKKIHFSSSSMAPSSSTWLEKSLSEIRPSLNISGVSTYLVLTRVELRGKSEWSRCFFFACGHWHKANIFADDHGRVLVRFCWSLRGFMWYSTWVIGLFILNIFSSWSYRCVHKYLYSVCVSSLSYNQPWVHGSC